MKNVRKIRNFSSQYWRLQNTLSVERILWNSIKAVWPLPLLGCSWRGMSLVRVLYLIHWLKAVCSMLNRYSISHCHCCIQWLHFCWSILWNQNHYVIILHSRPNQLLFLCPSQKGKSEGVFLVPYSIWNSRTLLGWSLSPSVCQSVSMSVPPLLSQHGVNTVLTRCWHWCWHGVNTVLTRC